MKKTLLAALLFGSLIAGTSAQAATTVVYPTGQYPVDVQNAQAALDLGGTVLLKATSTSGAPTAFNFGPAVVGSGSVTFHRDAELIGERVGGAVTTIAGGYAPVRGFDAFTAAVRSIAFDGPLSFAIFFSQPPDANTEITGNRISHVVGLFFRPLGFTTAAAIEVGGGRFVIDDNVVNAVDADFGQGISEGNSAGPVDIFRNQISGTSGYGIEASGLPSQGAVRIEDNVLRPGSNADFFPGSGIALGGTGAYTVEHNDVLIEVPWGIGISAVGAPGFDLGPITNLVIDNNHIVLQPAGDVGGLLFDEGIELDGQVSGAYVGQNQIEGAGFSACSLFNVAPDGGPSDLGFNTLVGNNIARVHAQVADVFLDAASHDTVLKGFSGSVVDLGRNNSITGFTKRGQPGSGSQVSEAVHLRSVALQDAAVAAHAAHTLP